MSSNMASQHEALVKLQHYSSKVDKLSNINPISPAEEEVYANQLQRSLQSLQNQVNEHKAGLERVRIFLRAWPSSTA